MAKVFRLFKDRDLQDWEDRGEAYGPSIIEDIKNPDGDYSKNDPTSVPSPFARIDLARAAFKYVVDSKDFNGTTIYHKLVSDCLDVAELFFNVDKLGDRAQILSWDKEIDLNKLLESNNPKHRLYGETLDLFLKQDAQSNNFDKLKKLYFVIYDNKIVGGTSPTTLFFSSANDLSFASIDNGNTVLFDKKLTPLYQRDLEFQKYLYLLFSAYPELATSMRDFSSYLADNLKILDNTNNALYKEITDYEATDARELITILNNTYDALDTGAQGSKLEVLGNPLKKVKIADRKILIEENSEFVINSNKSALKPLVLQNNFSDSLVYTDINVLWNSNWKVPYHDERSMDERTLPEQIDKYPYLTVSDFLQPNLIRLNYPINKEKYFDGNVRYEGGDQTKSFILPLKNEFFNYFNTSDLQRSMHDGKPMFEMVVYPNSVEVYIRIPIRGNVSVNYITFWRTYDNPTAKDDGTFVTKKSDITKNKGSVTENSISLVVYPFIKVNDEEKSFYRIMFLDNDISHNKKDLNYNLAFYNNQGNNPIKLKDKKNRSEKSDIYIQTDFYVLENKFDYIEVGNENSYGIIIPLLIQVSQGTDSFSFAIDFGTTNTHIEYKINSEKNIKPLDINIKDVQYATMFSSEILGDSRFFEANNMSEFIRHELFPSLINSESEFNFPTRTVLNESKKLNIQKSTYSLADFNIPFDYEKYVSKDNSEISTNLKWSNDDENLIRIERYFENLLFLIRTKILRNNGKLSKTKLTWFYPSSMSSTRRDDLGKLWNELFKKYISEDNIPTGLSESIAPYYFYMKKRGISAANKPVVGIDIGGGTSDIVIYQGKKPILLSSVRFAANTVFGDAYGNSPETNGFVLKFKELFYNLLETNELNDLCAVLEQISHKEKSEDISTYLFSLENNKSILENNIPISYNQKLVKDDELKIVFLTFFASIMYHVAKLMKANDLIIPKNIIFSGTGSKMLSLADGSVDHNKLKKLTELIFKKVYKHDEISKIVIEQDKNPKEITCKGGLLIDVDIEDVEDIKTVLLGDNENTLVPRESFKYSEIENHPKLDNVVKEVNNFINILFEIHEDFNFSKNFGINARHIDDYKEILKDDLMGYLKEGIQSKIDELQGNTKIDIEESLFFYPLVGAINKLAYKISQYDEN
ncbi:cell division protein FtsA [uncultured Kordia sp.]|uniref:cell division protein FtsA n=1 Tax=uncultured Kordia sp. TaxID=507699 RepID=UPI0026207373|nr:cell division protein FtsA [uncultured Kordia sp.]